MHDGARTPLLTLQNLSKPRANGENLMNNNRKKSQSRSDSEHNARRGSYCTRRETNSTGTPQESICCNQVNIAAKLFFTKQTNYVHGNKRSSRLPHRNVLPPGEVFKSRQYQGFGLPAEPRQRFSLEFSANGAQRAEPWGERFRHARPKRNSITGLVFYSTLGAERTERGKQKAVNSTLKQEPPRVG
jgi:hypothetical protein